MGFNERRVQFDWHNQRPEAFGYKFRSKQEIREKYQDYLEQKTTKALLDIKKDGGSFNKLAGWLIDEILEGRKPSDLLP